MKIAYFVHDLLDPAVSRRVRMFVAGGAEVDLYGFRRGDAPATVGGVAFHDLGRTHDGRLLDRAVAVGRTVAAVGRLPDRLRRADAFVGRNLEMLAVAARARALFRPAAPLSYELLDIHGALLGAGPAHRALRALEGWLLGRCRLVMISSPAFEREYLDRYHPAHPPCLLVENKVFSEPDGLNASAGGTPAPPGVSAGPPWRIGWFGVLRCRRSLDILAEVARSNPGLVEIDLRGRRAVTDMGDWEGIVANTPGLRFHGPYLNPRDLPVIYGAVHFTWAIDFFEEGLNSSWLLPNRLYEGPSQGAVPLALEGVETGRWLEARGLGVLLREPLTEALTALLRAMTPERWAALAGAVRAVDQTAFTSTPDEARALVKALVAG